ncbi:HET-domain-containing protein [Apiospora hydei]|uniref:HET-domain-containing protein n=1 Tax=Apiospora hydei TaxID=1337664 RepID=A0ABR1V648_9PEZI
MPRPCQLCHGLQPNSGTSRLFLECKPDDLLQSANLGCESCGFLLRGLQAKEDSSWSLKDVSTVYGYGFRSEHDTLTLEIYFVQERPKVVLEFFVTDFTKPLQCEAIRPRASMNGHPMSARALNWVISKLQTCNDEHACYGQAKTPLPRRILALDASHRTVSVKVVEKDGSTAREKYAALSHCWGQGLRCTLTKANLEDMKAGVPWKELPKTFQDAIRFCLRLDLHYLWIDSLCIIQDDPGDWQVESAKMADIYQNSYITLAATAAASGDIGMFPRKSRWSKEPKVSFTDSSGSISWIGVRHRLSHWTFPMSTKSMRENPLLTRGWAFQERLLSPRVLHFCNEELVWECRSITTCECGSMPVLPSIKQQFAVDANNISLANDGSIAPKWNTDPTVHPSYQSKDLSALKCAETAWIRIVEQYSSLSLTRGTDRLPALSGLVARMADILGPGSYKAGLWAPSIRRHLTWRVDTISPGHRRPRYRWPTWSWASVDAKVTFWEEKDMRSPIGPLAMMPQRQWSPAGRAMKEWKPLA